MWHPAWYHRLVLDAIADVAVLLEVPHGACFPSHIGHGRTDLHKVLNVRQQCSTVDHELVPILALPRRRHSHWTSHQVVQTRTMPRKLADERGC